MPAPNFNNRTLYHLDNLDVLRGMNSESVHLIATDPPFNKGRDFHATPDSLKVVAVGSLGTGEQRLSLSQILFVFYPPSQR